VDHRSATTCTTTSRARPSRRPGPRDGYYSGAIVDPGLTDPGDAREGRTVRPILTRMDRHERHHRVRAGARRRDRHDQPPQTVWTAIARRARGFRAGSRPRSRQHRAVSQHAGSRRATASDVRPRSLEALGWLGCSTAGCRRVVAAGRDRRGQAVRRRAAAGYARRRDRRAIRAPRLRSLLRLEYLGP
jgi:hypothetical protein